MKLAFVQDWLVDFGGAERCLEVLCEAFPEAKVHTLFYDPKQFEGTAIAQRPIHTTFLNHPFLRSRYRSFLGLFPYAVEQLDLSEADTVLSFSHSVAHGALVRSDAVHLCYCHTPVRYAWDLYQPYLRLAGLQKGIRSHAARAILHYIRLWDAAASSRVDRYLANSKNVARRIQRIYGRKATVVYPPVEVERFAPAPRRSDHYLVVGRMVPYKRGDVAVAACTRLGLPLRVVGDGPEYGKLRRLAGPSVEFTGRLSDAEVAGEMARAKALLFCGEEDFGITPVEAQAAGTPVVAFGRGGALETVIPPRGDDCSEATGLFFEEQTVASLAAALRRFEALAHRFRPEVLRRNAERFSRARYLAEMTAWLKKSREEIRDER